MRPLSEVLAARNQGWPRRVTLPANSQCPTCGFWDADDSEVVELCREAGRNPAEAACQCAAREFQARQASLERWEQASIPHCGPGTTPRSLSTFERREGTAEVLAAIDDLLAGRLRLLVLGGEHKTGKSHLLEGVGRQWLHDGGTCRYDYGPAFVFELQAAALGGGEGVHGMLAWRATLGLHILDDLGQGSKGASDFVRTVLTDVVDERLRSGGRLLVASNRNRQEIAEEYGERLASRLWEQGKVVYLACGPWQDFAPKAPYRNDF